MAPRHDDVTLQLMTVDDVNIVKLQDVGQSGGDVGQKLKIHVHFKMSFLTWSNGCHDNQQTENNPCINVCVCVCADPMSVVEPRNEGMQ